MLKRTTYTFIILISLSKRVTLHMTKHKSTQLQSEWRSNKPKEAETPVGVQKSFKMLYKSTIKAMKTEK